MADPRLEPGARGRWRLLASPLVLVAAALVLRLMVLVALDAPSAAAGRTPWEWGAEQACLADSLRRGDGFGDPWAHGTGPSAWLTPVYPLLIAACMEVGGGVTPAAAWLLFAVQSVFDALTAWLLLRLGRHLGRPLGGVCAGWLWALFPLALWHATNTVWDTTLVAFALTLFCERFAVLVARAGPAPQRAERSLWADAGAGLFFGGLLFVNPAPQAIAPIVLLAVWLAGHRRSVAARAQSSAAFALGVLAICGPWIVRNHLVLGTLQLRPNFGVELMIANHDRANGHPEPFKYHPSHIPAERERYLELGEVAYGGESQARAWAWMRKKPAAFAALSVKRFALFWVGRPPTHDPRMSVGVGAAADPRSWLKWVAFAAVGLGGWFGLARSGLPARMRLFGAAVFLLYGVPYYLSHVSERYRFPIDQLLVLAIGLALWRTGKPERDPSRAVAVATPAPDC